MTMYNTLNASRLSRTVDICKGLGIVLVVLGHVIRGLGNSELIHISKYWHDIDRVIYEFHMPLFFFLSGLYIERSVKSRNFYRYFAGQIKTLIVPLVFWSYLQVSIQTIFSTNAGNTDNIFEILMSIFPPRYHFWYLWALFQVSLIAALSLRRHSGLLMIVAFSILCLGLSQFGLGQADGPNIGSNIVRYFPYLAIGIWTARYISSPNIDDFTTRAAIASLTLLVYFKIFSLSELLNGFLVATLWICLVFSGIFMLAAKDVLIIRALRYLGLNSMIIYLAHVIALASTRTALLKIGVDNEFVHLLAGLSFGLILPLAFVLIKPRMPSGLLSTFSLLFPIKNARS